MPPFQSSLFTLHSSIFTLHSSILTLHPSFPGSQWIATGFALAITPRACHCEEQRDAAIHRVSRGAFRLFSSDLNLENGFWDLFPEQIPQDFFGQSFVNLSMAGNGLGQTLIRVMINIVLGSVPEQLATTFLELLDESDSLHATSS